MLPIICNHTTVTEVAACRTACHYCRRSGAALCTEVD